MRLTRLIGTICVLPMLLIAFAAPRVGAEEEKEELSDPDESYFVVEGESFAENKTEPPPENSEDSYDVTVDLLKKGSKTTTKSSITFPYVKFNWSIQSWYRSSYGLRFYNVQYNGEKILYDYRIPWIEIDDTKYDLTKSTSIDGPDLYVYNTAKAFKVWVKYNIDEEDVEIQVYCYFFDDGLMEPWAIVDCHDTDREIVVPQRFDFDLDEAGDDNADYYRSHWWGNGWDVVEEEDNLPDAGEPEDNGIQWTFYDTDRDGMGFECDQIVMIYPYHPDDSFVSILRYHGGQVGGDPLSYDNDEITGIFSPGEFDPFIGYDNVAWYEAIYISEDWCNPGPWLLVEV